MGIKLHFKFLTIIMKSVTTIYRQCMPIKQALSNLSNLSKIGRVLSLFLCTAPFVSLNADIALNFEELTTANNVYGSSGVEISWTGTLNTEGLQGNISPAGRLLVQSSFSSLSRSKEMHFASSSSGFTIWTTTNTRTSDAAEGAFIPNPILEINSARQNFQYFSPSPSESESASNNFIVIGDTFGIQQTIDATSNQVTETAILTPLGYDSGDSITGTAFLRNVTLSDLRLPSLRELIEANEFFETSVNIGPDTITYRVVPEPSTYALILGGLVLGVIIFRKQSS